MITTTRLEVRLAWRRQDVAAAQALRYRVFYKEMGAAANLRTRVLRRDIDRFDRACDHLLVIDHATRRRSIRPVFGSVVGTCRLIRQDVADRRGGFYSADEFDLTTLLDQAGRCLEVGRSCVAPDYRSRAVKARRRDFAARRPGSRHAPMRLLTRCLLPWLRVAFGGRYDARSKQSVSIAGLRPVWRRSYLRDSVVPLALESAWRHPPGRAALTAGAHGDDTFDPDRAWPPLARRQVCSSPGIHP